MRLENYYSLITKQQGLTLVDEYNSLDELFDHIDLDDKDRLNEFERIEITHDIEYYDGSYDHITLYQWENGKCTTLDAELTKALSHKEKIPYDRLSDLLFNAIVYLENDFDDKEQLLDELGMTEEEYKNIMGEE